MPTFPCTSFLHPDRLSIVRVIPACFLARASLILVFLVLMPWAASPVGATAAISQQTTQRTITIATGEYPPWTGAELPSHGLVNQIIHEAFASQKIAVKFSFLPWKRALEETRQGRFDASSYWYDDEERRTYMLFSEPILVNRTVFFQRAEDPHIQWHTFADLGNYRIGATLGFTYTPDFHTAVAAGVISPQMVSSDPQNIKLLMSRRIDLFATEEMAGFYMAAQLRIDPRKLLVVEPPLNVSNGHLLIRKNHPQGPEIMALFNRGLKSIKANGKYQKILARADETSFYDITNTEKQIRSSPGKDAR